MSTKFTPGPWSEGGIFYYHDGSPPRRNIWGPINRPAGHSSGSLICEKATIEDAALIADAPAMYALLEKIVELNDPDSLSDQLTDHRLRDEHMALYVQAEALLARHHS